MTTLPHYHKTQRAFDAVCLRMREAAVRSPIEHAARVLMSDLATFTPSVEARMKNIFSGVKF